jgi:hypothetical protein
VDGFPSLQDALEACEEFDSELAALIKQNERSLLEIRFASVFRFLEAGVAVVVVVVVTVAPAIAAAAGAATASFPNPAFVSGRMVALAVRYDLEVAKREQGEGDEDVAGRAMRSGMEASGEDGGLRRPPTASGLPSGRPPTASSGSSTRPMTASGNRLLGAM